MRRSLCSVFVVVAVTQLRERVYTISVVMMKSLCHLRVVTAVCQLHATVIVLVLMMTVSMMDRVQLVALMMTTAWQYSLRSHQLWWMMQARTHRATMVMMTLGITTSPNHIRVMQVTAGMSVHI